VTEEKDFDLRANGKVWFRAGATEYLCRRPTVGDLGKLLEMRAELVTRERDALKAKPSGAEHSVFQARLVGQWTHDALGMLAEKGDMPTVDDMPAWATSVGLPDKLISHWQSVPLGPSGGQ
jgi:hypothetical protein